MSLGRPGSLRVSKSGYKEPETAHAFTIADNEEFECGVVSDLRDSDVMAEALVSASASSEEKSERAEARDFVRSILADGPMATAEVLKLTRQSGFSDTTVKRARSDLGVRSKQRHDPQRAGWPDGSWNCHPYPVVPRD